MPITKSAKKALRQSKTRQAQNLRRKKTVKGLIKEISVVVKEGNKEKANEMLPKVYKAIDKAKKSGILKKNTANRRKSTVARIVK